MSSTSLKVESGLQLFARLNNKNNILNFYSSLFQDGPKPGEIIEIFGNSETGKTFLLIDLICAALMPSLLGGVETEVIVFITDGNMSIHLLIGILKQKILSRIETKLEHVSCIEQQVELICHESLKRLHIMEIYDAAQFYITIQNLEAIILQHPNISLLTFDTLTAYYWSEQTFKKMDSYLKYILKLVQRATREYKCVIVYTRPQYFQSNKATIENLEICSKTPSPECVNYRINLTSNNSSEGNTVYQATVKNINTNFMKRFSIINNTLLWLCQK